MTKNGKKSWTRKLTAAAALTVMLVSGGVVASAQDVSVLAGDGPGRCC